MLSRVLQTCRSGRLLARSCAKTRPLDTLQRQQLSCLAVPQWAQGSQQAAPAAVAAVRWRGLSSAAAQRGSKRPASKAPAAEAEGSSDEEEFEDDDEEGVLGELLEGEEEEEWEELEDDVGQQLSTGGVAWGEAALGVVQRLLAAGAPELQDIQLFSFRAIPSSKRLDIRLDKTTDRYGSPSLDDVAAFSRLFNEAYEAAVGEAEAGGIEVEVSSPGAERQVRVPGELQRFAELPMRVEYCLEEGQVDTRVLSFLEHDAAAGVTKWKLADVRVNRTGGKGRGLNRKQRDAVYELPVAALRRVCLHLDF